MTEGTNMCATFRDGSDIVLDYCCYVCEQNGVQREAAQYCEQCSKSYCDTCVPLHDQMFKTHVLIGRGDMQNWPVPRATVDALTQCQEHNNETIIAFCEDHSALCCVKCLTIKHRHCNKVEVISDAVKNRLPVDLQSILQDLATQVHQLQTLKTAREENKKTLSTSCENILAQLSDFRQTINAVLDNLEKETVKTLECLHTTFFDLIEPDIERCYEEVTELQSLKAIVESIEKKDDQKVHSLSYLVNMKCVNKLAESRSLLQEMSKVKKYQMNFEIRHDIVHYLSTLCGLGELRTYNPCHILSINGDPAKYQPTQGSIRGICEITPNITVVANFEKHLVQLDSEYNVCCRSSVLTSAYDMCHIDFDEVAVTLDNAENHIIEIYKINENTLSRTKCLFLPHRCRGIAYNMNFLHVTSGTALHQYMFDGSFVKTLYEDRTNDFAVYKVAVGTGRIFVTNNSGHQLIALSMDGTLLASFRDPQLRSPSAVHVSTTGQVLVCGRKSNTILQIDGESPGKLLVVATDKDGLNNPRSIYYSETTTTLLIGQDNGLLVFKL